MTSYQHDHQTRIPDLRDIPMDRLASVSAEPGSGWPGVVRYSLENWPRTMRLCMIVVVVGAVLLLAAELGLRFWL